MTTEQAKQLKAGNYIHSVTRKNADGTPMRARVTSVKTWKTRPTDVEVHYKRGMYEYGTFRQFDLSDIEAGYGDE